MDMPSFYRNCPGLPTAGKIEKRKGREREEGEKREWEKPTAGLFLTQSSLCLSLCFSLTLPWGNQPLSLSRPSLTMGS
jgi:hypothetical protein